MTEPTSISMLEHTNRMLTAIENWADEVISQDAAAAKHYARKYNLAKEARECAYRIEVTAELKLGEILIEMQKKGLLKTGR
jgi:hypothetical protein